MGGLYLDQLLFFKHIEEKEIRPFVIEELRKYRVLRIRFQNQQERTELGAELLFSELKQVMVRSHLLSLQGKLNLKPSQIRKWKSQDKWDELFN